MSDYHHGVHVAVGLLNYTTILKNWAIWTYFTFLLRKELNLSSQLWRCGTKTDHCLMTYQVTFFNRLGLNEAVKNTGCTWHCRH